MTAKTLILVCLGASLAAIVATVMSKMLGVGSSAAVGGGVGAVGGVIAAWQSPTNK